MIVFFSDGVSDREEEQALDCAQSQPTEFAIFDAILDRYEEWIEEHRARFFKASAVFAQVGEILCLVPLEAQIFHFPIVITNV